MKRLAVALAFGAALAPGANALEYTALRPEASAITFAYQQMGVGLEGRFTRFDGELSFDPAQPEAARARIEVELASIDTGSPEGNDEVAGKAWFDTPSFPATSVTIATADGGRAMSLRHLEPGVASRAVDAPKIDPSYRCCVAPVAR